MRQPFCTDLPEVTSYDTIQPLLIPEFKLYIAIMGSVGFNTDQWLAAGAHRRTTYGVKGTSAVSDARIQEIVENILTWVPSAFNMQSVRISLAFGEKHKQFWDVVLRESEPVLKAKGGEAVWNLLGGNSKTHRDGYGSVCPFTPPRW